MQPVDAGFEGKFIILSPFLTFVSREVRIMSLCCLGNTADYLINIYRFELI